MESKANYTIVGLFVIILLSVIIIIALWLSTGIEKKNYKTFLVYMNESVAGLNEKAPVKYNGVDVGTVKSIRLNLENPEQVILALDIEPNIPVTESTTAVLMEQGITGIAYIGLQGGKSAPVLEAKPGQHYPVIKSAPSFLVRLDTTLQSLTSNIETLSVNVKSLLSKDNLDSLQRSLINIEKITGTLANNNEAIDSTLKDMKIVMHNTSDASKRFPDVTKAIQKTATVLQKMSEQIAGTANNFNQTIQSFSDQLMPEAYSSLKNMRIITGNLSGLSRDLRQNPSIIIRGKEPPPPGPGE